MALGLGSMHADLRDHAQLTEPDVFADTVGNQIAHIRVGFYQPPTEVSALWKKPEPLRIRVFKLSEATLLRCKLVNIKTCREDDS